MTLETVTALAGLAVSMTWTPGPNNMMLAASGANFGWRATMGHAMGVAVGFPIMLFLVAMGLGQVLIAFPLLTDVLKAIGFAAMVWFAWKIATARAATPDGTARPMTFLQACGFQWVNPKAWTFAIWVAASYVTSLTSAALASIVFLLSGLGSAQAWTLFGSIIGELLGTGWRLRVFNLAMATLLVGCALWLVLQS